jgi:hypothetical protein
MRFDMICETNEIEPRLIKPNRPSISGQVDLPGDFSPVATGVLRKEGTGAEANDTNRRAEMNSP